jgi:hypothetical protein
MPAYKYEALDVDGKATSGLLEADSAKAARTQLRSQSLVPLAVTPVGTAGEGGAPAKFTRRVFSTTTLTVWTRQLAGLVSSGLPLERALTALADEADDPRQRELVAHLKSEVNAGSPFARALATAPKEFDDVYRAVVAAGEQSGALGRRARTTGRRSGAAPGAAREGDRRDALPGHRVGHRAGDRDLPRHLRGAAGGVGVRQLQTRVAVPDDDDAGHQRLRAPTGAGCSRWHWWAG